MKILKHSDKALEKLCTPTSQLRMDTHALHEEKTVMCTRYFRQLQLAPLWPLGLLHGFGIKGGFSFHSGVTEG